MDNKSTSLCVNELMPQCSVELIFIISVVIHAKATAFNNNYETKNPNVIGKFYSINAVKLNF